MLAELQRDFRAWLVEASDDAATRLGAGRNGAAGLSVYQNNYRSQLVGCLEATYPLLRTFIGPEAFLAAAVSHIDTCPPHAWTLDAYGRDFDETLASLFPDNPDVEELAWIELALSEAFVATDAAPTPLEALSTVDWNTARLRLSPSLRIRTATTNASDLWSALVDDTEAPESRMLEEPVGLIAWRRDFTCRLRQTDSVERDALIQLQADGRFATLCEMLVQRLGDEGVARAGALLADWLGSAVVTGVDEA